MVDLDGRRHTLCIPEGKGLLNGWILMAEKLRSLGVSLVHKEIPKRKEPNLKREEELKAGWRRRFLFCRCAEEERECWSVQHDWMLVVFSQMFPWRC